MIWQKRALPENIFLREMWGFLGLGLYFGLLPLLLAKTLFKKIYGQLGPLRYRHFYGFITAGR